jgi:hypothetical protein
MARVRADHPLEALFDAVVISCEVGLAKPDPRGSACPPPSRSSWTIARTTSRPPRPSVR